MTQFGNIIAVLLEPIRELGYIKFVIISHLHHLFIGAFDLIAYIKNDITMRLHSAKFKELFHNVEEDR